MYNTTTYKSTIQEVGSPSKERDLTNPEDYLQLEVADANNRNKQVEVSNLQTIINNYFRSNPKRKRAIGGDYKIASFNVSTNQGDGRVFAQEEDGAVRVILGKKGKQRIARIESDFYKKTY